MKSSTLYSVLWIAWLVAFLVIEFSALLQGRPEWTLSEYVWRVEKLGATWTFLRYFVAVFCLWLFFHMAFGWWR